MTPNGRAAVGVGAGVFTSSWYPLFVALTGAGTGPFVFLFWFLFVQIIISLLYLTLLRDDVVWISGLWMAAVRKLRTSAGALALINPLYSVFFVGSALFIDTALVAVISTAGTVLFVLFRQRHGRQRSSQRYQNMLMSDWALLSVTAVGIVLVVLSQSGGLAINGVRWHLPVGIVLAVVTVFCGSCAAHRFKLGEDLYNNFNKISDVPEMACLMVVSVVTASAAAAAGFVFALLSQPGSLVSSDIGGAVVAGTLVGISRMCRWYANLITSNLGVNAISYVGPVLSLVWLNQFSTIEVFHTDWLFVGASAVIVGNALINFKSAKRPNLKPLSLTHSNGSAAPEPP